MLLERLLHGSVDVMTKEDFVHRFEGGRPLRIKAGFDPTRPDLHLGHMVLLKKMREFQDLGHTIVLIVGDFTAMIGDPSGKSKARPKLSKEEVIKNAHTYTDQAFLILDRAKTEIRFNSEWLSALDPTDFFEIVSKVTTEQLLARRDFRLRLESKKDIFIHEIIYPVLQGYDSVAVKADLEIGGTDQLFNLLMGREMMNGWGMRPQIVMTMPLLVGTDARVEDGKIVGLKMSKSLDNYIGLTESSESIKRKILSLDERVTCEYVRLLSGNQRLLSDCRKFLENGRSLAGIGLELSEELATRLHH